MHARALYVTEQSLARMSSLTAGFMSMQSLQGKLLKFLFMRNNWHCFKEVTVHTTVLFMIKQQTTT